MYMYVHRNTIKIFTVVNKTLQKLYSQANHSLPDCKGSTESA